MSHESNEDSKKRKSLRFSCPLESGEKVPVVAMNHSGVSDIIEHGVNGYLADNPTEFSTSLQTLIENPALRAEFSQKAAEELPKYDWNRIH
jgi:1,2-diacylglycerol 3-alpha-glucosyltransferase